LPEELPDFAEVDGSTVKLSGLDFSLVKQEAEKGRKKDVLSNIKLKLDQYNHRMPIVALPQHTSSLKHA